MLVIKHIELKQANTYVEEHHRHHKPVIQHRFSIACYDGDELRGVAIIGRPKARQIDQINTVEVLRLCTDGTRNACSILYAAARRAARELGYERIITYILEEKPGTSLRAAGYEYQYTTRGESWDRPGRPRSDNAPTCPKKLYQSILREERHCEKDKNRVV